MSDEKIVKLNSASDKMSALERRVRQVLELDPSARLRAILDDPKAGAVVKAMPPQELLLTIKQVGEHDAIPLIELASPKQLIFLTDIEWWIGDTLDPDRILHWMELLLECGEKKVIEWLRNVDAELLVTLLRKFLVVTKPDKDTQPEILVDSLPPITFDGVYHLNFFNEDAYRILSKVMALFVIERRDLYWRILEGIIWESGPETQELATRLRNGRLRDIGIPDMDEALEIYRYLDERRFWNLPPKDRPARLGDEDIAPRYTLAPLSGERIYLISAMAIIEETEVLDGLFQELAHLVNRVLVADHEDMADASAVIRAAQKIRATVSMGLEILSSGDVVRAVEILRSRWLLYVFQVGYSRALKLSRLAHKMERKGLLSKIPEAVELLDEPLKQLFDGVKRPRPMWHIGGPDPYRAFLSIDEIARARRALEKIEFLFDLFFDRLKLLKPDPSSWLHKRVYPTNVTFSTVLRTAFANAAAGRGFEYKALRISDLKTIVENAFEEKHGKVAKRYLRESVRSDLTAYLEAQKTAKNDLEREFRDEFIKSCLDALEEELGRLDPTKPIDPRFIQGLLIRK